MKNDNKFQSLETGRRAVAREEIDTAIALLFSGKSQIAATLLAWAAVDVLRGVAKISGKKTMREKFDDMIKPDKLKFWREIERQSYNFFKHADKDAEESLQFKPEGLAFALLYAVHDYGEIYGTSTLPMRMYFAWFLARYPNLFLEGLEDKASEFKRSFQLQDGQTFSEAVTAGSWLFQEFEANKALFISWLPPEVRNTLEL